MREKSVGYHSFNLYAFGLLAEHLPKQAFWNGSEMARMVAYAVSEKYTDALNENRYGYPYNPPGFEIAYAMATFPQHFAQGHGFATADWVSAQLSRCYDRGTRLMSLDTDDPATHAARLYEATRLGDLDVRLTT